MFSICSIAWLAWGSEVEQMPQTRCMTFVFLSPFWSTWQLIVVNWDSQVISTSDAQQLKVSAPNFAAIFS